MADAFRTPLTPLDADPGTPGGRPAFPIRIAAIDIGSNAIRFSAVEFHNATRQTRLDSSRAPVRLGRDAFRDGSLSEGSIERAVEALRGFRRQMDVLGVSRYRAVATSAVRDSDNGDLLIQRVREVAAIEVDAISGAEEAALVWAAIRDRVDLADGEWVLVDVGGGSVEVSLVSRDEVLSSESHQLGTVRLLEDMREDSGTDPRRTRRILEDHAALLRVPRVERVRGMIATGGNIDALADLAGVPEGINGLRELPVADLAAIIDRLSRLTVTERIRQLNLREDRADVILPAALFYARIAELVGTDRILVPGVGLREGVLLDLLEDTLEPARHHQRLELQVTGSALSLGRHYGFDEAHARHVALLALRLFDQLSGLHGLGDVERRTLLAAALLHDIGQFVGYRRHHKHSQYLISHSEVAGLGAAEQRMAALLARYHRRAVPREGHEVFSDLDADDRARVRTLAAILRVADALDREHEQCVRGVRANVGDKEIVLAVEAAGDLFAEEWAFDRKADLFREVFGRELRLVRLPSVG